MINACFHWIPFLFLTLLSSLCRVFAKAMSVTHSARSACSVLSTSSACSACSTRNALTYSCPKKRRSMMRKRVILYHKIHMIFVKSQVVKVGKVLRKVNASLGVLRSQ